MLKKSQEQCNLAEKYVSLHKNDYLYFNINSIKSYKKYRFELQKVHCCTKDISADF